jgi:ACS family hexuronate transporter-like MFS transporter
MTLPGMRWWIVVLICLGTIVNYLSRNTLGVLAPMLQTELNFTTRQYSYVVGAFQAAYTVMQPVCGYILDTIGARAGFALFALLWSAASCFHVFATGWMSLAAFRGWLGLAEAAAIPAGAKAIGEWFPARERSIGMGLFNVGTSLGAMLAPTMVVFVEEYFGWRAAFLVTGAMGFVFALLWWGLYRTPSRHPWASTAEREMIVAGQPPPIAEAKPSVRSILSTRRFWGIGIPRFLFEPAWQTFTFWIPLYLVRVRGMDLHEMALFAWLPFLAADLGGITGGFLSPFFMRYCRFGLVNSRLAGIVVGCILMIGPGCIGLAADKHVAVALFCVGGFAHQMISSLIYTLSTDKFAAHEVATASGLAGTAGWIGGLGFSLVVGALADTVGYNPLFVCLSVFDLVGAAVAVTLLREPRSAA